MLGRTDLAIECREMFAEEIAGVESNERQSDGVHVTHIKIVDEEGASKIGKPIGNYVTIEIDSMDFENDEAVKRGSEAVCEELKKLIDTQKDLSVLVVGLGNRYITPDSVGPKAADKIFVTRHLHELKEMQFDFDFRPVSAVSPGVLGLTGIETGEIVYGIKERIKPDVIIAIDALASRSLSRLGSTVQIADTGINPGSGVGNNRKELSYKSLGVKVIAIGVPMVVDAAAMVEETLEAIKANSPQNAMSEGMKNIDEKQQFNIISEALKKEGTNMIVTPNNVDIISSQAAQIIAEGINKALHKDIFD